MRHRGAKGHRLSGAGARPPAARAASRPVLTPRTRQPLSWLVPYLNFTSPEQINSNAEATTHTPLYLPPVRPPSASKPGARSGTQERPAPMSTRTSEQPDRREHGREPASSLSVDFRSSRWRISGSDPRARTSHEEPHHSVALPIENSCSQSALPTEPAECPAWALKPLSLGAALASGKRRGRIEDEHCAPARREV